MDRPGSIVPDPIVGILDGKIAFVTRGPFTPDLYPCRQFIDGTGCIVMPGLVNVHAHLAMSCFRGLADDLPLMAWLNDHIFPAEARFIDRRTVYAGATLSMCEMILSGTTTFCDAYFFEGEVGRAAMSLGMRGVIAQGFIDFPTPDLPDPPDKAAVAERFVDRWRGVSPLLTPALVCHAPYTCSPETLRTIKEVSRRTGVTFQIHLAETREEVRMVLERYGRKPAHHLQHLGLLDEHTIAAHCIWLDEDELDLLAAGGVKVAHDPESNMKLAAGVAPLPSMLRKGIEVGLGTDGSASNNDIDLFSEMGMTAKLHKAFAGDPTVLKAEQVVAMATIGGARVLGLADRIGSIVPGKEADIILLDMRQPHLTPVYNPFSHLVYAARGADVSTSIIAGRIVMRDRQLPHIDVAEAMERVRAIASSIRAAGFHRRACREGAPPGGG
jgi:5-methylthioadenosine/S-adenosylhomocysteine deaminase